MHIISPEMFFSILLQEKPSGWRTSVRSCRAPCVHQGKIFILDLVTWSESVHQAVGSDIFSVTACMIDPMFFFSFKRQPLLLVSLDGLRAEYLQTWNTLVPVLDKLS